MQIIEFFTNNTIDKSYWISEISKSNDSFLSGLLKNDKLRDRFGRTTLLYMLVDNDTLLAYLVCSTKGIINSIKKSYWISFFYSFDTNNCEEYRSTLLDYAECVCTVMGKSKMYIATNENIYEKYGYIYQENALDDSGYEIKVYTKDLKTESNEKARRNNLGNTYKAKIVNDARYHIDARAYCGLSCNHCFLAEYCGGCKSNFNCCSFGGLYEDGKCPNETCALSKNLNGCYECDNLVECNKGFFDINKSHGAIASKAMSLFIQKYGNKELVKVQNRMNELYNFEKAQEILNGDLNDSLSKLEQIYKSIG